MRSTLAFAASVYHGPCQSAKHAPEFKREALFCLDIRSSRFLIGMPIPHATHVCRARTLERLTWGRRSAPRKALRRGFNLRPTSSNPLQNSNANLFLSARTRAGEVHKMLRRNHLFASCRWASAWNLCISSALGQRTWPKVAQNSNPEPFFELMHNSAGSWMRQAVLGNYGLAASSGGIIRVLAERESVQNSNASRVSVS